MAPAAAGAFSCRKRTVVRVMVTCHTRVMGDEQLNTADIDSKPIYQASMRLASGPTFRVTVVNGEVLADFRDDEGRAVPALLAGSEPFEMASMLNAADRRLH